MLLRIEEGRVVPIVGQDLLAIADAGDELLHPLLARRLAESLHVSETGLPRGGELQEVCRRYLTIPRDVQELYRILRAVFRELEPIPVPEPLLQLARISKFELFVTTTFDVLTERAVDLERFDGQRQTLAFAYAPNDKQDLPPEFDRLGRPAVFHLMGRLSRTPHSYALTREDHLEFMESLQSKTEDAPRFLSDKLRKCDLLIVGCHAAEWLARLFTDHAGPLETRSLDALHPAGSAEACPLLFVQRFRGSTRILRSHGSADFVSELHRRWSELRPEEAGPLLPELGLVAPGVQPGAVLLSASQEDRAEADSLRDALDAAGVDVVLDRDDLELGEKWDKKLRSFLGECCLFVPLFSARSRGARRRFQRREWIEAILETRSSAPSGSFVLPVVLDESSTEMLSLPPELGELRFERVPRGEAGVDFVRQIVRLQRHYRSASFA